MLSFYIKVVVRYSHNPGIFAGKAKQVYLVIFSVKGLVLYACESFYRITGDAFK